MKLYLNQQDLFWESAWARFHSLTHSVSKSSSGEEGEGSHGHQKTKRRACWRSPGSWQKGLHLSYCCTRRVCPRTSVLTPLIVLTVYFAGCLSSAQNVILRWNLNQRTLEKRLFELCPAPSIEPNSLNLPRHLSLTRTKILYSVAQGRGKRPYFPHVLS